MSSNPFCLWPWFHQKVDPDGIVKPCCIWGQDQNLSTDRVGYLNGPIAENLRELFRNQIPHEKCEHCIYVESTDKHYNSVRKQSFDAAEKLSIDIDALDFTKDYVLRSEEVALSTLCNLKCRMCGPHRSTKWIADSIAMGKPTSGLVESNWTLSDEQVETINNIILPGGEPMLHQDIICKELMKIKDANRLHLLHLSFNSNMTIELCDELIDLISQTKHSVISCSIDGVGKINDYIRSDSVWEEIDHNMKLLLNISRRYNNLSFNVHTVYNVFNAHCFDEITTWGRQYTDDVTLTIQMHPKFQDAINLPTDYKLELIEKYNNCLNNICEHEMPYYTTSLKSIIAHLKNTQKISFKKWVSIFKKHNDFLDKRRHVNLVDVNPRLHTIINEQISI